MRLKMIDLDKFALKANGDPEKIYKNSGFFTAYMVSCEGRDIIASTKEMALQYARNDLSLGRSVEIKPIKIN